MSEGRKRRDKRYQFPLAVELSYGGRQQSLLTDNVSFRGLFARTDDPPPERALLELRTELPPDGVEFVTRVMAVWVVEPAQASAEQAPGVGLQFYAMGGQRIEWEKFILHARRNAESTSWSQQPLPPEVPDATRRRHPRRGVRLGVQPSGLDELVQMYTRDISAGGMFLRTDHEFPVGTELELRVRHPETDAEFDLVAAVRRISKDPDDPGLGVEFVGLSDEQREAFRAFAHTTVEELDATDLEFVEEDDDNLE